MNLVRGDNWKKCNSDGYCIEREFEGWIGGEKNVGWDGFRFDVEIKFANESLIGSFFD